LTGRSAASARSKRSSSSRAPSGPTPAEPVQPTDHVEVLEPGQVLVDGGVLPGHPDAFADPLGLGEHVHAGDLGAAGVRLQQGRQDPDRRGLAGTVRPEQPEHGPLGTCRSSPSSARTSP
jgi:hypothetical protein